MSKPIINVEFDMTQSNKPAWVIGGKYKHYKIKIFVGNVPADTRAVTYELHETYIDPIREVPNSVPDFAFHTTSYGDYEIKAKIRSKEYASYISRMLSDALLDSYKGTTDPDMVAAIEDIKKY